MKERVNSTDAPRSIAYKCKTPGCQAWLKTGELPNDTARKIHFVLRIGEPQRLQCPDCGQAYDYSPAEKQEVRFTD